MSSLRIISDNHAHPKRTNLGQETETSQPTGARGRKTAIEPTSLPKPAKKTHVCDVGIGKSRKTRARRQICAWRAILRRLVACTVERNRGLELSRGVPNGKLRLCKVLIVKTRCRSGTLTVRWGYRRYGQIRNTTGQQSPLYVQKQTSRRQAKLGGKSALSLSGSSETATPTSGFLSMTTERASQGSGSA